MKNKITRLIIGVAIIVLGGFLAVNPGNILSIIAKVLAGVLLLASLSSFYNTKELEKKNINMVMGVLLLILSLVAFLVDDNIGTVFSILSGIFFVVLSFSFLKSKMKKSMIYSVGVMFLSAILLIFSSFIEVISHDNMRGFLYIIFGLHYLNGLIVEEDKFDIVVKN